MADKSSLTGNPELDLLRTNKESGFNYRERRQGDWKENYALYRDKVTVNRLTQRQSVNVPLMKQTVKTLLKDVDDMPVLFFENLDNDKQKEAFQNEYWKWTASEEVNNLELKDIIDKKQVFLFGRTFDQMQIADGRILIDIQDPEDILIDRYTDPANIDTARFLIHTHIFRPLSVIENNPDYDKGAIARLRLFYATEAGLIKAADNLNMLSIKNEKMADMGLRDVEAPTLGESYVELSMHFVMYKEPGDAEEQYYLWVECDDMEILMKKRLEEVIGTTKDNFWRNHLPYNSWADDIERQDFWSDGVGDVVRTSNKVLNAWLSQLVENRTLRNFGMHYYDSSLEGFSPQTFEVVPWGWYGVPGNPNEVLKKVDIPDLSESLDEMQFLISMVEKATGATPTQQGVTNERQITLGEVQLALGEAKERIKGMSKFYTVAWKQRGLKFLKLIEAAPDKLDAVKIYKKGRSSDKVYGREISSKDWMTQSGYSVRVWSQDEKETHDVNAIQRINAVKSLMPDNPKLNEVYQMKLLEFSGLTPDQIGEIMDFERRKLEAYGGMMPPVVQSGQVPGRVPAPTPQPQPMGQTA